METITIGIIGASRIAPSAIIAPARVMPGIRVASIAARDTRRAIAFAAAHDIKRVHSSYDTLFSDPGLALVYIATPPATHAALAIRAIRAGKAVLVEKPFAMNAQEAERVAVEADHAGVPVFEAMHSTYHPLFAHLRGLLADGRIGSLRSIDAYFTTPIDADPDDFRYHAALGGGSLMDLGVYPLAWCRALAGDAFTVTAAQARFRGGVDVAFNADLLFPGVVRARIAAAMDGPAQDSRLQLAGEAGAIVVDNPLTPHEGHRVRMRVGTQVSEWTVAGPTTYLAQLTAVCEAVRANSPIEGATHSYVAAMQGVDRVRRAFATVRS